MRNDRMNTALTALLASRQGGRRPVGFPQDQKPETFAEAYAWQDALVAQIGPVAGWKVGADTPDSEPFRAALNADTLHLAPAQLPGSRYGVIGVEAEIVYTLAKALPIRSVPYTRSEVLDAIGSVHAGIEIVDTRFAAWGMVDRPSQIVDQFNHGALVIGEGRPEGFEVDPHEQEVELALNGETVLRKRGGNSAGDAVRLLVWLANGGAAGQGGLAAGARITTGSWTGSLFVGSGTQVLVRFSGIGTASLDITKA
jgi:2-keto-4-pentenoate hydratase